MFKPLGYAARKITDMAAVANPDITVRGQAEITIREQCDWCGSHLRHSPAADRCKALAARLSRKSRSRVFASSSLTAIVAIKLSMRKPASESARAIRGKA